MDFYPNYYKVQENNNRRSFFALQLNLRETIEQMDSDV